MILFFFLHPGSQIRAGMPPCPLFFLQLLIGYKRLRFARAGTIHGGPCLAPGMLVRVPVHGMQGFWNVKSVKPYPEHL